MRSRAATLAPDASQGNWRSNEKFFRAGALGEWRGRYSDADIAYYEDRLAALTDATIGAWIERGRLGSGIDPDAV